MNGFVKVKAKELLLNNTLSLFLTSATAFILKTSSLTIAVLVTHFSLVSSLLQWLLLTYDRFTVYFIYSLIIVLIWFFVALFISGLKLGENAIYYMQSKGTKPKFKYLFIFIRPSQSLRSFLLFTKIKILKLCWFLFFFASPCFCFGTICLLYLKSETYTVVFNTLIVGTAFLTSISLFFYNCIKIRYYYAPYYLCTDLNISTSEALKKSIVTSDGFIKEGAFFKAGLSPWALACLLVIPAFYVIPYIKLSTAKFTTFSEGLRHSLPQIISATEIISDN